MDSKAATALATPLAEVAHSTLRSLPSVATMPLRLPPEIGSVTLDKDDHAVSYFPIGFFPFAEYQLGNGDYFGLYWPIGQEDREPLVVETFHDEGTLQPTYSSLAHFLTLAANTEDEHPEAPTYQEDPTAPLGSYLEARRLLGEQHVEAAVELLQTIVQRLPEYTNALGLLAAQYVRLGRTDDACRTALRAIVAPPSFGQLPQNIASWLVRHQEPPMDLQDDPVWLRRAELMTIPSGGTKHGGAYSALTHAIDTYIAQDQIAQALMLMQTYSEFMNGETRSFQERHSYDFRAWRERQRVLSEQLPHGPRQIR